MVVVGIFRVFAAGGHSLSGFGNTTGSVGSDEPIFSPTDPYRHTPDTRTRSHHHLIHPRTDPPPSRLSITPSSYPSPDIFDILDKFSALSGFTFAAPHHDGAHELLRFLVWTVAPRIPLSPTFSAFKNPCLQCFCPPSQLYPIQPS